MKGQITILRRPAGVVAVVAAAAALAPGSGLADPQSHVRLHQPEIISGLAAPTEAQRARVPEIVAGIVPQNASGQRVNRQTKQYQTGPAVKGENYYARGLAAKAVAAAAASGSTTSGFPWGDATLGASVAFALSLLAAGGVLAARRHRGTLGTS
jgi:hypothetical protein